MARLLVVVGAGGHAKVVVATLRAIGRRPAKLFDDDPAKWGSTLLGVPIVGPIATVLDEAADGAIGAIGDNATRERLLQRLDLEWISAVHPAAFVDPSAALGAGSVVFAGAIIQPDATVGRHVIVNTSASIDHDSIVADFAHLAPGARLGGEARVGTRSFVGIGAKVLPGIVIGDDATVGAGAVVTTDVAAGQTVVGVPARPLGAGT